jgi:hypothetical protein
LRPHELKLEFKVFLQAELILMEQSSALGEQGVVLGKE